MSAKKEIVIPFGNGLGVRIRKLQDAFEVAITRGSGNLPINREVRTIGKAFFADEAKQCVGCCSEEPKEEKPKKVKKEPSLSL